MDVDNQMQTEQIPPTNQYEEPPYTETQEEKIAKFARMAAPTVVAVGLGGAGCNVITWVKEKGMTGGKLVAVNTDATHLQISKADKRILIGERITRGLGSGGYPDVGERALLETSNEVIYELARANIVFMVAGLGGGTGTGNLPFREALGVANTTVGKFIKGITETITTASLINMDYADLKAIMTGAGLASIGIGEGTGETRVEQAVEKP